MKKYSTKFLKLTLFIIALPVIAATIFIGTKLINNSISSDYLNLIIPIVIGLYGSSVPFYFALYRSYNLLTCIDNNTAFSQISVDNLKKIKIFANIIIGIYILIMPFIFLLADKDDAPGLIIVGMLPLFAAMVISVFAAVLQRLLEDAINIKAENDLTV